jgi:hypothetical protein
MIAKPATAVQTASARELNSSTRSAGNATCTTVARASNNITILGGRYCKSFSLIGPAVPGELKV